VNLSIHIWHPSKATKTDFLTRIGCIVATNYFPLRKRRGLLNKASLIHWWQHKIPAHKREGGGVAEVH
jgi:hypothetical protein